MTTQDDDIAELSRLLGHTKGAYEGLRHSEALEEPVAQKSARRMPRVLAVAASIAVVAAILGMLPLAPGDTPSEGNHTRLTLPSPAAMPSTVNANAFAKLSSVLPNKPFTLGFSTPRRPNRDHD